MPVTGPGSVPIPSPLPWRLRRGRLRRSRHDLLPRRLLYPSLPLAAVMALSVFLRFWQLSAVGFNSDEAVYTGSAASHRGKHHAGGRCSRCSGRIRCCSRRCCRWSLRVHDTDWTARAFAAAIGVATVGLTFLLGRKLYGTAAGLLAAALLAVMPYHVVVSRQVLLDGLMTLCATVALYCVARYVENGRLSWLLACGSMMSAAILSKETSVVLLGGLYVFFALTPAARLRVRQLWLALLLIVARGGDLAGHAPPRRAQPAPARATWSGSCSGGPTTEPGSTSPSCPAGSAPPCWSPRSPG